MIQNRSLKKTVAYTLIAAMLNPAAMLPAYALDTDIFLNPPTGATYGEPNIMIVLDTSDSMWIPEPWHEIQQNELVNQSNVDDPLNYDSHYEYLWNDTTFINSIGCNVGACASGVDQFTNAGKNLARFSDYDVLMTTMPQGFFEGATAAARGTLKQAAAITWATATNPGDPGARSTYRNYGGGATSTVASSALYDSSWVYWLPTGTPETDLRLMSTSPSRAELGSRVSRFSNSNGLLNDPVVRGGINYGSGFDHAFNNFNASTLAYQQATNGVANVCTTSYPNLLPSTVYAPGPYAKNAGKWLGQRWVRYERFLGLDNSRVPKYPASAAGIAAQAQWVLAPYWSGNMDTSPNHLGTTPAVTQMMDHDFAPIRTLASVVSGSLGTVTTEFAGWTDLRTDMGGHSYRDWLYNMSDAGASNTVLVNTLVAFGITTNATEARVRAAVRTFETGAHVVSTVKFPTCTNAATCALAGVSLGIPAYVDFLSSHPNPAIVPVSTVCAWTPSDGRLNAGTDAKTATHFYRSGVAGTATNPSCVKVSGPGTCGVNPGVVWSPNDNKNSAWVGRSTLVNEGSTYFYGGTCRGQCSYGTGNISLCPAGANAAPGPSNVSSFQPAPTYSTKTVNSPASITVGGVTITDWRTDNITAGCSDNGDAATIACNVKTPGCVDPTYNLTCNPTNPPVSTLPAYDRAGSDAALVHDCLADNGVANYNPNTSYVRSQNRTFNTGYNTGAAPLNAGDSYSTTAGDAIGVNAAKNVDMYSVNYLNWKYGPRGPNGRQIARKTRIQIAKDALAGLVQATNGVRYGLMVFNGQPADITKRNNEGSQGARVVYPITRMGSSVTDLPDANNRATLITRIMAQEAKAATPLTESIYEAMLYFSGRAPRFGTNAAINSNFGATSLAAAGGGNVADGADPNAVCTSSIAGCPTGAAIGNPLYKSPMLNNPTTASLAVCQRNFIVLITDGGPDRDRDANTQIKNTAWAQSATVTISAKTTVDDELANTATDQLETSPGVPFGPISPSDTAFDGGYVWLDELASFMNRADLSPGAKIFVGDTGTDLIAKTQSVKLFTIGFAGVSSPVLQNAATGSFKTAQNAVELIAALQAAVSNITNSNATIASPTVPISAANKGQNSDEVYLSFFKPTTNSAWEGTLKKYKLGLRVLDSKICGVDGGGVPIEACLTGQTDLCGAGCKNIEQFVTTGSPPTTSVIINPNAVSFWSSTAASPPGPGPDGGQPNQGGSGQVLILGNNAAVTPATRNVYTHLSGQTNHVLTNVTNKVGEANATITECLLGDTVACLTPAAPAMTPAMRTTLINFIRGGDQGTAACTTPGTPCINWRSWAHAAVQHASPVVVTYNPTSQFVFYLSVDGLLHAVDSSTGQEQWAFLVEEALPQLSALMTNNPGPPIQVADGSISFFHKDFNGDGIVNNIGGTDQVLMFFGLRRGGRAYYALDITNIASPVFKWKITNTQICSPSCTPSATYAKLGQTWSTPIVARLHETSIVASGFPALVFSGGYDPNQDINPAPAIGTDTMGKALFVVKSTDGSLVKEFSDSNVTGGMLSAIPSNPAVLNANLDSQNFIDRIYVGDVAANVYRFDVDNPNVAIWTGKKLAALSDTAPPNRKILFPPVVVKQSVTVGLIKQDFDAVYIGTGDREHPLVTPSSDKIFMIKDTDIGLTSTPGYLATFPGDFLTLNATSALGVDPTALLAVKGWSRDLDPGEKVTDSPSVLNGILRFPSFIPGDPNICAAGGQGRLHALDATNGTFVLAGGTVGFSPDTSSGLMSGSMQLLINGKVVVVNFGIAGPKPGQIGKDVQSTQTPVPAQGRVYWYMEPEL